MCAGVLPLLRDLRAPAYTAQKPDMRWVMEADALYLTPAFIALAHIYQTEAHDAISSYLLFLITFVPLYVVAFAALVAFYFVPAVSRANRAIYMKRSMLLYLPPPLISKAAPLRLLVAGILAELSGDALGGGGSRGLAGGPRTAAAAAAEDAAGHGSGNEGSRRGSKTGATGLRGGSAMAPMGMPLESPSSASAGAGVAEAPGMGRM